MEAPQSSSPPHQYPQAIQLKLYQAFIFSIPILFSIILFLLFYLFYLKRRASAFTSNPPLLPRTIDDANVTSSDLDLKNQLKNNLSAVLFDDYHKARDPVCCVCLGEFELKEELLQVPSCKHMFHVDCICHWLYSSSTCPLCRAPVVSDSTKNNSLQSHHPRLYEYYPANVMPENGESNNRQVVVPPLATTTLVA